MASETSPPSLGIAGALFSNVQRRVLALLFSQPDRSFYVSELIERAGSGSGAVQRQLARLEASGIISARREGNQKHYRANRNSPVFAELRGLILKTVGLVVPLRNALKPFGEKIQVAFVYGSVAKGTDTSASDIDLMVLGEDLTYADLFAGLQEAEATLQRAVNPTFMSPAQWRQKFSKDDSFVARIAAQPKVFVAGSESDLRHEYCGARQSREGRPAEKGAGQSRRI